MDAGERSKDLYETVGGYPKPPLIPLREPDNLESLDDFGLKSGPVSRGIVKAVMAVTGFKAFRRQLPDALEDLLRRCDLRGANLFALVNSATIALDDDPRGLDPIERAATLVFAARSFYDDLITGKVSPDEHRGQVLEMGQYYNLFSTCLTIDRKRARLFKSTDVSRITVIVAARFYLLDVGKPGSETTVGQLAEVISGTVSAAQRRRRRLDEPSPGILTCLDHRTQLKAFRQLQKSETNTEALAAIRHSFLTLCLDLDSSPSSYADAALMAQSGNMANRWHHSSLQLVVFANAKAAGICNFSAYLDGNTMTRAGSELQTRAMECRLGNGGERKVAQLPSPTELRWEVSQRLVQKAQNKLRKFLDNQQATFEIRGIGKSHLSAPNVEPVPAFVLALQLTAKRLIGKTVRIDQFLTMSKYRCMDLELANVATPEVMRFVEYLDGTDVQLDRAAALMQEATNSQVQKCHDVRRHLSLVSILRLFISSRKGARRFYVSASTTLALLLLHMLGQVESHDVVVSHPAIQSGVPLLGRPGVRLPYIKYFALHYQIMDDKTVVTLMPSVSWPISNGELMAQLRENLKRIHHVVASISDTQTGVLSPSGRN